MAPVLKEKKKPLFKPRISHSKEFFPCYTKLGVLSVPVCVCVCVCVCVYVCVGGEEGILAPPFNEIVGYSCCVCDSFKPWSLRFLGGKTKMFAAI